MTRTYATLEVSHATYEEIQVKLIAAGYNVVDPRTGAIDMHGIGLVPQAPPQEERAAAALDRWRESERARLARGR